MLLGNSAWVIIRVRKWARVLSDASLPALNTPIRTLTCVQLSSSACSITNLSDIQVTLSTLLDPFLITPPQEYLAWLRCYQPLHFRLYILRPATSLSRMASFERHRESKSGSQNSTVKVPSKRWRNGLNKQHNSSSTTTTPLPPQQ